MNSCESGSAKVWAIKHVGDKKPMFYFSTRAEARHELKLMKSKCPKKPCKHFRIAVYISWLRISMELKEAAAKFANTLMLDPALNEWFDQNLPARIAAKFEAAVEEFLAESVPVEILPYCSCSAADCDHCFPEVDPKWSPMP